jgi:hypothetical protein
MARVNLHGVRVITIATAAALGLSSSLGGCSGGTSPATVPNPVGAMQNGLPQLPRPTLLPPHACADESHALAGDACLTTPVGPQHTMAPGTGALRFEPQWTDSHSSTPSDLAYALYTFPWAYDGAVLELDLAWEAWPGAERVWIGFASYPNDRWEWYGVAEGELLIPPKTADYINYVDDSVTVAVVLTGTQAATLNSITLNGYWPATLSVVDELSTGDGSETYPFIVPNRTTLRFRVTPWESLENIATDPAVAYFIVPEAAGSFHLLRTSAALTITESYTGSFIVYATYHGHLALPGPIRFTAQPNTAANQPPVPSLQADPIYGSPPLAVQFEARDSYDPDGLITSLSWDYDGDGSADETGLNYSPSHTYAVAGTYQARLTAYDAQGACASQAVPVTASSEPAQWHLLKLREAASGERGAVGAACYVGAADGRPAVLFTEYDEAAGATVLRFARAADSLGATWGSPSVVGTAGLDLNGSSCTFSGIGGSPAAVFTAKDPADGLYYARALDAQGTAWPASAQFVEAGAGGYQPQLLDLGGLPALAYRAQGANYDLVFNKGVDATGSSFTGRTVLDSNAGHPALSVIGEYARLVLVGGNPAVAYLARHIAAEEGNEVRYLRASDSGGMSWGAPSTVYQAESAGQGLALAELAGGLPGVWYQDYSGDKAQIGFKAGTDAAGTGWGGATVAASYPLPDFTFPAQAVVLNGKPVVGAIAQHGIWWDSGDALDCRALDSGGANWEAPQTIGTGAGVSALSLVLADSLLVACYADTEEDALYFAAYY